MIASVSGKVIGAGERFLVVETGGIGYRVYVTTATRADAGMGSAITLFTYHHVSDTANDLYGFLSLPDVEFFELLLTISSVGPKTALNVMGIASMEELQTAIQHGDPTILTKVSGVGRKTAERIVLELKEKIDASAPAASGTLKDDAAVLDALVSLGYSRGEARDALRAVPKTVVGISERVREALKQLGGHGTRHTNE